MRITFSEQEINDLLKAWVALSFAFAITNKALQGGLLFSFLISGLVVGTAFILHELAHKYVAQRYGCWAEFRSFDLGLVLAVLMSFTGFIFAAPGAVVIMGRVTPEENGKIAAAGPLTNIVLAIAFLVLLTTLPVFFGFFSRAALTFLVYAFRVNAWLALFNLLPFWQLDGAKVLAWQPSVWGGLSLAAAVLVFFPF